MPDIGPLELVIILVIVLLVFGPKRLPGLGRQLGTGMREFKDSITGKDRDRDDDAEPARDRLPAPSTAAATAATREPEVVTAEARPEDQPAPRRD
jgi:sec-independent protein translocase protein TatA